MLRMLLITPVQPAADTLSYTDAGNCGVQRAECGVRRCGVIAHTGHEISFAHSIAPMGPPPSSFVGLVPVSALLHSDPRPAQGRRRSAASGGAGLEVGAYVPGQSDSRTEDSGRARRRRRYQSTRRGA